MTMGFSVPYTTLLAKLVVGKQAQVEFHKEGPNYVVVGVR
jgi:Cu/Ag efflux protein CusF